MQLQSILELQNILQAFIISQIKHIYTHRLHYANCSSKHVQVWIYCDIKGTPCWNDQDEPRYKFGKREEKQDKIRKSGGVARRGGGLYQEDDISFV